MPGLMKLVAALKTLDRKLWPAHRAVLSAELRALLTTRNLMVADVGAADGPEDRWFGVRDLTRFLTFEPNPRPEIASDDRTVCLPFGLWSSKGEQTLYLTEHPDSASLYPVNEEVFRDFLVKAGMRGAGTIQIQLDTLDNTLCARQELSPDFLKIDVEGADLDVLCGATLALARSVMGIRVETSLLELRRGAPKLWDIDAFLRERGFVLFHLGRVHWIRNSGLYGFSSEPQLIWGDAVYFLTRPELLRRLEACPVPERERMLARFVLILLCHGVHDYAIEAVEAAEAGRLVTPAFATAAAVSIHRSADKSVRHFLWLSAGVAFALSVCVLCWPVPGARARGRYYLKQRAGRLCYELCRWASRAGRPENACVEDPFV